MGRRSAVGKNLSLLFFLRRRESWLSCMEVGN